MLNELNKKSYNENISAYQKKSCPVSENETRFILRSLHGLTINNLILEIGSGLGERSAIIEKAGYDILRTDASQSFIDYLSLSHKAVLLDVLSDQLPRADAVFASAVFLHFNPDDLFFVLRKINRSLPPRGRLIFSLKAGRGGSLLSEGGMGPRFFYFYQPQQIIDFLDRAGFSISEINISGYKPTWIQVAAAKRSEDFPF